MAANKAEDQKPLKLEEKQLLTPPKISVPKINVETSKKMTSNGSPRLQRALTKPASARWNCLCSPTTHAGSFRCRFHRTPGMVRGGSVGSNLSELAAKSHSIRDLI
ncbi:uncharacterized protein LOC125369817 [Ricinus communis]|uniref:uncharacterized protein LOC125369817 n=1 Tax=Ricinus communis TaxID=3988 RepID=UPI00201A92FC|nr:uncharacterized protein LOC125369817 [Ricinus communis]